MTMIRAYCGLDCGECEAYVATQKNDRAGLEAAAKKWTAQFGGKDMGADVCVCDGCSTGKRTSTAHAVDVRHPRLRLGPRRRHLRPLRGLRLRHPAADSSPSRPSSKRSSKRSARRREVNRTRGELPNAPQSAPKESGTSRIVATRPLSIAPRALSEAGQVGDEREFRPILDTAFHSDSFDMGLDRIGRNEESSGDLMIIQSEPDQAEDPEFAVAEEIDLRDGHFFLRNELALGVFPIPSPC